MADNDVQSWEQWRKDFDEGETVAAYLFISGIILSVLAALVFGANLFTRIIGVVGAVALVGALVDTTAHLFVSGYTKHLSADDGRAYLMDFIKGRTHVLYGLIVSQFVSVGVLVVSWVMRSFTFSVVVFGVLIIMVDILGTIAIINARY